jgi:MFS family permease
MSNPIQARAFLASRSFQFLLLTLAGAANMLAKNALSPLQETMRVALSLSDNQMALLQGPAQSLPVLFAGIPLGFAIDRHSRVRLALAFSACGVAGSVLTALASSFVLLFIARCVVGLAVAAVAIAAYSLLADHYAPAQRGRAKAVLVIGQYGGASAAFALGGALLVMFGSEPAGWRWAMLWLSVPLGLVTLSMLAMREPARSGIVVKNPTTRESWIELWRYRAIVAPLLVGLVMIDMAITAVLTWAAPALSRNLGLEPHRVGAIMAIALMVSGLAGPVAGGSFADLCQRGGKPHRSMHVLCVLALLGLPASVFAILPGVQCESALLIVFITLVSATVAMGMTLFTVVIPNELRGLSLSLLTIVNVLVASSLAPLAVSLLSGWLGGAAMIGKALALTCATSMLLAAATFGLGARHFRASLS